MCKAMEEIKKRERAKGFEEGFKEGFEEGFEEGLEESCEKVIEALVETMHEFDYPKERIVKQVEKKFSLTRDEVENAVESCFVEQLS